MSINISLQSFFRSSSYHVINIDEKIPTRRAALASGKIFIAPEVLEKIAHKTLAKGDVIPISEIVGINGAKSVATLLPLCHQLPLDHVVIQNHVNFDNNCVDVYCYVTAFAKTGVEMEAIAGVQAALLCIYDLCKMYGHAMTLSDIRLLYKQGGKSYKICYPEYLPEALCILAKADPQTLSNIDIAVLTISDRASKGIYQDQSGALLQTKLKAEGANIVFYTVIPDKKDQIIATIKTIMQKCRPSVIFTTGGTGVSCTDTTPEAIKEVIQYEIPGIGELLRSTGAKHTPFSWISRSIAGLCVCERTPNERTIIFSFPGSSKAVAQGLEAIKEVLPHLLKMIKGEDHN